MSPQRIILVFVLLHYFSPIDFQVGGALSITSIAKARRTQSMRPLTYRRSGNNLNTQSGSESSGSSITELRTAADSQPIASTSARKEIDSTSFKEVDLHPLVEKAKRTSFINSVDLNEASLSTHSNGNINPGRDGVFSRVRNAMLRYGAAVAIGSVVGVGGFEVKEKLFPVHNNTNITQVNNIQKYQDSNTTPDPDGIINPMD